MPMGNTFAEETENNKAKAFLLLSNTAGVTSSWILKQPKAIRESFTLLAELLKIRFPVEEPANTQEKAMTAFLGLKQRNRRLKEYFEEAREIQKELYEEMESQVARLLVAGLDNEFPRRIVGGLLGKKTGKMLEEKI